MILLFLILILNINNLVYDFNYTSYKKYNCLDNTYFVYIYVRTYISNSFSCIEPTTMFTF